MDVIKAAAATLDVLQRSGRLVQGAPTARPDVNPCSLQHAAYLLTVLPEFGVLFPEKAMRWLGWAQCILCAHGISSLDELKAINHAS